MPKRAWALMVALSVFAVLVLSVVIWANASGRAGTQRGLVIHSELNRDTVVRLANGQNQTIGPDRSEYTFVLKREQFPSVIGVYETSGALLYERRFAYEDFAAAEFRLSIDDRGFYATTDLREPIRTPAPEGGTR